MKKLITIALLFLYSITTTGATMHIHYCMGKFTGLSLFGGSKSCEKCGMAMGKKESCCKDEHKHIQLKDNHQKPVSLNFSGYNPHALLVPLFTHLFNIIPSPERLYGDIIIPSVRPKSKLNLLYSVYLI